MIRMNSKLRNCELITFATFVLSYNQFISTAIAGSVQQLTITHSESWNHQGEHTPDKAHDGDYNTFYSVKDETMAGNCLKLYLSKSYSISKVLIISRKPYGGIDVPLRMVNTEVRAFSTLGNTGQIVSCGKITEKKPGDQESIEGRTYTIQCGGVVGDMVYLTDLDYSAISGHSIVEVEIFGTDFLPITKSDAYSWLSDDSRYGPASAHDGQYNTFYHAKDGDVIGNFLKLFLARKYRIGTVLVVNRDNCCKERIEGTVVSIYDVSSETEVKICGKITDHDPSITYQIFTISCEGAVGDMIYITDVELERNQEIAHAIAEVYVFSDSSVGNSYQIQIEFKPNADVTKLTASLYGIIAGVPIPFPLPQPDACVSCGNVCPTSAGTDTTYSQALKVESAYPAMKIVSRWVLQSQDRKTVCVEIPVVIVS